MKAYNWEITTGCTNLGGGCESCPSLWEARKNYGVEGHKFAHGYGLKIHWDRLDYPKSIKGVAAINISLGSDLFHESVPLEFIQKVFDVSRGTPHLYEVCTKRAERMASLVNHLDWPDNLSVGVTVEAKEYAWRIDYLRRVPVATRYVSMVPLLGDPGKLDLTGISFLGYSPETWGLKRECKEEWVRSIYEQCEEQGVYVLENLAMYVGA